jgi:hypothetical protein
MRVFECVVQGCAGLNSVVFDAWSKFWTDIDHVHRDAIIINRRIHLSSGLFSRSQISPLIEFDILHFVLDGLPECYIQSLIQTNMSSHPSHLGQV